jgi:hypothetical protein
LCEPIPRLTASSLPHQTPTSQNNKPQQQISFTKKNELLHGRLAALGFLAALVNEAYTGLGPVGQVAWWLGTTQPSDAWYSQAGSVLVAFAALMTALAYASGRGGTFEGEDDIY